ncbi:MAG: DUF4331 family protein [Flavobacteriaceae bacterium]
MKNNKLTILFVLLFVSLLFVQCRDDDDNGNVIEQETCDDGIQNGDETGIDCGGSVCSPCTDDENINFDGNFVQEDVLGRPGVNTIFGGTNLLKNNFNITEVNNRETFQSSFDTILEQYHNIYAEALEIPTDELNYETNILGWDAEKFTRIMAQYDGLQVAPNGTTTYYNANSNLVFTGRSLSDDVMDVNLMLLFGGVDGTRFDGNNDTPQLTTDAVEADGHDFTLSFPYLEAPLNE